MADEERFHFFPRYTISSLRLSGNDFDDVPEIFGSFRVIVECICVNLGIFCQIKVILPLMEHKFLWNALSGDQQNLIIFLVCYKTYIREPIFNCHPGTGPQEKPGRMRIVFSPQQLERLERHFKVQQYVGSAQRIYIASQLGLSETQVKVWFQTRRIRMEKASARWCNSEDSRRIVNNRRV